MFRSFITKFLQTLLVLLIVSIAAFWFLKMAPGDPVTMLLGSEFSPQAYAKLTHELGLDQPVHVQYIQWLERFVRGDWGISYVTRDNIFKQAVLQALPVTLSLTALSLLLALLIGIPAGMLAALYRGKFVDMAVSSLSVIGSAFPSFYLGILLIWVFGVALGWFPTMGFVRPWDDLLSGLHHLALPAITLASYYAGLIAITTRSSLIEVLEQPFIKAVRARGEPMWRVICIHAMRNVMMPLVTVIGLQLGGLLRGAVMTEVVFAIPGLGMMITTAVLSREYGVVQAGVMLTALFFVLVNLLVDQTYEFLDPRLRLRR
ncbi:ABC transporter permease [Lacisediminimonas profundi]|uniref:ABC transporter permease n=1 Tax=Lacisediminimonas profundi TaxID=2603856 RepID=UPI00124BA72A|nr:ABC transporter permease [Lacisediminimonas profundi]